MGLSQENTGPLKVKKIPMYLLTRAEFLYTLCNEIPCTCQTDIRTRVDKPCANLVGIYYISPS